MNTFCQQPFDDVDVHFVAVPTNNTIAVDVPVTVYKVIHIAAIPFAACHDVLKIKLPRFGEQFVKFFRYILFRSEVVQMWSPFKKREDLLFCPFMSNCFYGFILIIIVALLRLFEKSEKSRKYLPVN